MRHKRLLTALATAGLTTALIAGPVAVTRSESGDLSTVTGQSIDAAHAGIADVWLSPGSPLHIPIRDWSGSRWTIAPGQRWANAISWYMPPRSIVTWRYAGEMNNRRTYNRLARAEVMHIYSDRTVMIISAVYI